MPDVLRPTVIVGNWKMNKTIIEARAFIAGLALTAHRPTTQVGVAVPFTMIAAAAEAARGSAIAIGAQNVSDMPDGAFTGEISCAMLKDAGASFVIIGHSERRRLYGENDEIVNRKALSAIAAGLRALVCIGETLEQRKGGSTQAVLAEQLVKGLKGFTPAHFEHLVLAYEPLWAIGTHQTATPEQAQETQHFCREKLAGEWGSDIAAKVVIQYGGSVRTDSAQALLVQPDIDGLLVGGGSLSLESFSKIIQD